MKESGFLSPKHCPLILKKLFACFNSLNYFFLLLFPLSINSLCNGHMSQNSAGVSSLQVDVTFFTPGGGPRVFNNVVILGISDGQNSVVHLTITIIKYFLGLGVIIFPFGSIDGN